MNDLKNFIGKPVSLFDTSGGVLDQNGEYVTDWWSLGEICLQSFRGKFMFLRNQETNEVGRIPMADVIDVHEGEITLDK